MYRSRKEHTAYRISTVCSCYVDGVSTKEFGGRQSANLSTRVAAIGDDVHVKVLFYRSKDGSVKGGGHLMLAPRSA